MQRNSITVYIEFSIFLLCAAVSKGELTYPKFRGYDQINHRAKSPPIRSITAQGDSVRKNEVFH